ncbi:MAG: hypothetical protein H0U60_05890 [Blastocatellia bacterium]|nr:hypothetical protein [Blastocatellia bacterium]
MNFVTTSNYVQVANPNMVAHLQLLDADYQIEMPNRNVIADPAFPDVDDAQANPHSLSDFVTKKQPIAGTLQKRWQQRNNGKQSQPGFA